MKTKDIFKKIRHFSLTTAHWINASHRNTTQSAEYGRSMVEMLGVLAVIGVLSVAGMMGYRYAMDKYRANDIIYEVNLRNRDTWHKYQLKGLPENEDMLNEWAEYTSTGFPIGVYLRSTDMFDVQVDDVPSRVCLNVLNTNLEGPLLIWVPTGEDEKQLFDGTNAEELCQYGEEDAENVSIVFTTSLSQYGAELGDGEAVDENGRPVRYCLDDGDCTGTCERCGSDYKCESTCPDATPICSATQGRCVRCEVNDDCPINQICNEATNECEEIPEACAEDEFRSRNGACIPCSHPSNVIINRDEVFGADKATGAELCANCANEGTARKLETAGSTTYCSYTCTKGISVQGQDGACHPCVNPDGTPNTEVFEIDGGTEAKEQCLACGDREWVQMGKMWCSPLKCESNQFIGKECSFHINACGEYPPICMDCSSSQIISYMGIANQVAIFSGPTNKETLIQLCNNCPNRQELNSYCVTKCDQPKENSEESTICKTDPGNEKCKRKWQNGYGDCLSCNQNGNSSLIFANRISSTLADLCEKCGRQVTPDGNCAPKQNLCGEGQIMDVSGNCISCTSASSAIIILSDEESGCTACNKDGQEIRWVISYTDGNTNLPVVKCMKKCNENQFQGTNGVCYDCSESSSPFTEGEQLQALCQSCSKPNERTLFNNQRHCGKKVCATNEFQDTYGACLSCNNTESGDLRGIDSERALLCEACGNRILSSGFCSLINPGVSGVCNSIENGEHEDYPAGDGVFFRDNTGICRRCDDPTTYTPSSGAQCKSCGNRRNDGGCALGLCTDGTTFLNINNQCISCTTSSKTEIDNITTSRSSCTECDNKRVMTAEDTSGTTKAYCVNDCFGQLQNVNGQCGGSSWGNFEIGSDDTSKSMCRNYERVVYSKINGDRTQWYCSSAPRDGYFININGGLSACTSGSTEIPKSNDARNLCLDCSTAQRTVVEKDGRFYCEKS